MEVFIYQNVCITMTGSLQPVFRQKSFKSSNVLKVTNPLSNHWLLDAEDHLSTSEKINSVVFEMVRISGFRWATRDLTSQGRLCIDSSGYKNMVITAGLGGSHLDAKGGVVGGNLDIHDLSTSGKAQGRKLGC